MSDRQESLSIVAVDTGGTFTDVVCLRGGELTVVKVPSTPADPSAAVLEGIARVLGAGAVAGFGEPGGAGGSDGPGGGRDESAAPEGPAPALPPVRYTLVHGSTVATNALLERRGARVGLVTNAGFEDVLEIGRQNRPQLYALVGTRPPPLVPTEDRHGVAGRIGPEGEEIEPLDVPALDGLAERLAGVESVAICFLHSYANPEHERRVAEALAGLGVPISISSELLPEYREYERTATTVVNAYVAPLMDRYLGRLETGSGARRIRIMGSGGGAVAVGRARHEPVHTVLSGPAGGVMGALHAAAAAGFDHIMGFDMGGTSTDVSLCPGRPSHTREFSIAGLPVAVQVLDIHTVGAGGGSLAWVDAGGALRVGPRSAGSEPGPICYAAGGTEVTVTDAHVWLGRLPADAFLGGERTLDRDAIAGPLARLAERIGTDSETAAEGVLAVADTAMEGALRVISVERGYDPADFTLVPFGGAAALHAIELARRLGAPRVLVPPDPGVLSAFGMLVAPVRKDAARTVLERIEAGAAGEAAARLEEAFVELERQALDAMAEEEIEAAHVALRRAIDARYHGQSFELTVPAGDGWVEAFHGAHENRYGYARRDATLEAVTLRVEATAGGIEPDRLPARAAVAAHGREGEDGGGDGKEGGSGTESDARGTAEEPGAAKEPGKHVDTAGHDASDQAGTTAGRHGSAGRAARQDARAAASPGAAGPSRPAPAGGRAADLAGLDRGDAADASTMEVYYHGTRVRALRRARVGLAPGEEVVGPAVITEYSATTWLPPGWRAKVLDGGALLATAAEGGGRDRR